MTKQVALLWVGALEPQVSSFVRFGVVHNDKGAFGLTAGDYTFELSLALTLAALVLIIPVARDLARVDERAPVALGLIAGGAFGNLVSLLLSPAGVVDFIAVQRADGAGIVLNVADIGAYAGVAMLMRTTALVIIAMRKNREQQAEVHAPEPHAVLNRVADLEVIRVVARDGEATVGRTERDSTAKRPPADRPVQLQIIHADGAPSRPGSALGARLRESTGGTRGLAGAAYLRPMSHGADFRGRR